MIRLLVEFLTGDTCLQKLADLYVSQASVTVIIDDCMIGLHLIFTNAVTSLAWGRKT